MPETGSGAWLWLGTKPLVAAGEMAFSVGFRTELSSLYLCCLPLVQSTCFPWKCWHAAACLSPSLAVTAWALSLPFPR